MDDRDLLARCRVLAAAGDSRAAATLRLIAERDELKRLVLAMGERMAGLVEIVHARAFKPKVAA